MLCHVRYFCQIGVLLPFSWHLILFSHLNISLFTKIKSILQSKIFMQSKWSFFLVELNVHYNLKQISFNGFRCIATACRAFIISCLLMFYCCCCCCYCLRCEYIWMNLLCEHFACSGCALHLVHKLFVMLLNSRRPHQDSKSNGPKSSSAGLGGSLW